MTIRRSSYSPSNAYRFLPIYDKCIDGLKDGTNFIVPYSLFPELGVATINAYINDGLRYLLDHYEEIEADDNNPVRPRHKLERYLVLRMMINFRVHIKGIEIKYRNLNRYKNLDQEIENANGWQTKLHDFLTNEHIKDLVIDSSKLDANIIGKILNILEQAQANNMLSEYSNDEAKQKIYVIK